MKKIIVTTILFTCLILSPQIVKAEQAYSEELLQNIYDSVEMNKIELPSENLFYEITGCENLYTLISEIISGEYVFDFNALWTSFTSVLLDQLRSAVPLVAGILVISLLSGLIQNIGASYLSKNIQSVAFTAIYVAVAMLLVYCINSVMDTSVNLIFDLSSLVGNIMPIAFVLLSLSGGVITQGILGTTLVFFIGIVTDLINNIIIPLSMFGFTLGIIGQFNKSIDISYFTAFIKKGCGYALGICFVLFSIIIKAQGVATVSLDGLLADTVKFTANRIPLIGKFLTDSAETVSAFVILIKNAFGFVAVILIFAVMLMPIIKILAAYFAVRISSIITQPFVDRRISRLLDTSASYLFFIGACTTAAGIMFISMIGIISSFGS